MHFVIGNFSRLTRVLPMIVACVAGGFLRHCEPLARPTPPANSVKSSSWGAARDFAPALLGGLRSVLAAGCWLRAYGAWERRDEPAMIAWLELTLAADDRPEYFWLNAARMIAYDVPTWGAHDNAHRREVCAQRAVALLEDGLQARGPDAALYIEQANIHWRVRGDLAAAAAGYREAAQLPGAPYYAARVHGELLSALHRPQDALRWWRQVLPTLPPDVPAARRAGVAAELER